MTANPLVFIEARLDSLNATDQRIAHWVQNNQEDASRLPIDQVAEELDVSKSTLVRFSQKLGFSGWASFKLEMARVLSSHESATGEDGLPTRAANRICETYANYLREMPDMIDQAALDTLAEQLLAADHVLIAGYDRSFFPAIQLHKRLLNIGVASQATPEINSLEGVFNRYSERGLVLFFTVRDNMRTFGKTVEALTMVGVHPTCITCTPALPFKSQCAHYITLPRVSRDPLVPFLDDEAVFFVFVEILIDAIAKHKAAQEG